MLVVVYTGEKDMSELAVQKISQILNCPIIDEESSIIEHYLRREKAVMVLKYYENWKKYKIMNSLLIFVFSPNAPSIFYDHVSNENKITYKVKFCNGIENLDSQLEGMRFETRPSWKKYFMDLAIFASYRSSCMKRSVGAILVKDKRILSTGFNGTPIGTLNCIDGGCSRCNGDSKSGHNLDLCVCLHAEESSIIGQSRETTRGAEMYVTLFPCALCLKKIIQSEIKRVFFKDFYSDADIFLKEKLEKCGIEVVHLNDMD